VLLSFTLRWFNNPGGGGVEREGYSTKFYKRKPHPKAEPLTFLYSILAEKVPSYIPT